MSARDELAAVLAEHLSLNGFDETGVWFKYACTCSAVGGSDGWHRRHLADMLLASPVFARLLDEARREALREAAADAYAAFTAGKTLGAPTDVWLRDRADGIGRDGGEDV